MIVLVDTSAFLAVLNRDDINHSAARTIWLGLIQGHDELLSTGYVLLETISLLQHRLGMDAVRVFSEDVLPLITIEWVTMELHSLGMGAMLHANRRNLSLTDCVSFEVMRRLKARRAFAFDRHFTEQGFELCI